MNFIVKTSFERCFGPFNSADDAAKWARDNIPISTQWTIVPVWSLEKVKK